MYEFPSACETANALLIVILKNSETGSDYSIKISLVYDWINRIKVDLSMLDLSSGVKINISEGFN